MPNEYFSFKQFRVEQDNCSMKVCTDSCVFGAWLAKKILEKSPATILDIGTGTGLLSLMIAQKSPAIIHSIDIDKNASIQAKENFELSPWPERLHIFNENIKTWSTTIKYDCIISNPPFYENDLLPNEDGKKNSKHSKELKLAELIIVVSSLLEINGFFGVLLPYSRAEYFEQQARKHGLFSTEKLFIRQSIKHDHFRAMLILEKKSKPVSQSEFSVKNYNNEYSDEFVDLLKDYYLHL